MNWTISAFFSSRLPRKSPANSWFLSEKAMFFYGDPRCFGSLDKFQDYIEISIKMAYVSRLSFHFLWPRYIFVKKNCINLLNFSHYRSSFNKILLLSNQTNIPIIKFELSQIQIEIESLHTWLKMLEKNTACINLCYFLKTQNICFNTIKLIILVTCYIPN